MEQAIQSVQSFFKRKDVVISAHRYGIDAMGAMAQGLFASLLIGTIIKTLGAQLGVPFLTDIGTYAMSVSGPAMAVAIGYALKADPMVLFSLAAVGWAANAEGGAGGPLAGVSGHGGRLCGGSRGPGHGRVHRLRAARAAAGAVQPDRRGRRCQ